MPAKNDILTAKPVVCLNYAVCLLWRSWFGRPLAKLLQRPLALRTITGFELIWHDGLAPNVALRRYRSIDGSKSNLKFVDLIPLIFGTLSLGNRKKLLQAVMRGNGLWFIHGILMQRFTDNYYHL